MNNSHNDFENTLRQAARRHTPAGDLEFRIMARYERERRLHRRRMLRRMALVSAATPLALLLLTALAGRLVSDDKLFMYGGRFCIAIAALYISVFISREDVISGVTFSDDAGQTDENTKKQKTL